MVLALTIALLMDCDRNRHSVCRRLQIAKATALGLFPQLGLSPFGILRSRTLSVDGHSIGNYAQPQSRNIRNIRNSLVGCASSLLLTRAIASLPRYADWPRSQKSRPCPVHYLFIKVHRLQPSAHRSGLQIA